MRHIEHDHAVSLMHWWSLLAETVFGVDSRLLVANPNGGRRHIGVARKLKDEGVRAGIPDYTLYVARKGYHGLLIELKEPKKGRVSDSQDEMMRLINHEGYLCAVARGWDEARMVIESYLGKKVTKQ